MLPIILLTLFLGNAWGCIIYGCSYNAAFRPVKRLDKSGVVTNITLSFFYTLLAIDHYIIVEVLDRRVSFREIIDPVMQNMVVVAIVLLVIFILACIIFIGLSIFLRNRGKSIWSFVVQFVPLAFFVVNLLLFLHTEELRFYI